MRQIRFRWKAIGILSIALLLPLGLYSCGVFTRKEEPPKVECTCPTTKVEASKEVLKKAPIVKPKVRTKESASEVNGYTCTNVRNAVSKYGKDAVTNEARSRYHLSDGRISKIYSTCGVR
jgi:hypothetical protein